MTARAHSSLAQPSRSATRADARSHKQRRPSRRRRQLQRSWRQTTATTDTIHYTGLRSRGIATTTITSSTHLPLHVGDPLTPMRSFFSGDCVTNATRTSPHQARTLVTMTVSPAMETSTGHRSTSIHCCEHPCPATWASSTLTLAVVAVVRGLRAVNNHNISNTSPSSCFSVAQLTVADHVLHYGVTAHAS